jgi:hypothetical protein
MPSLRFHTAREVYETFPTLNEDVVAAPTDKSPTDFLRALASGPTPEDAIGFCAYMLPRREAVWWGCSCLKGLAGAAAEATQGYRLADAWVREPSEQLRLAALSYGMESDRSQADAWIALAAGWSGGSMMPEAVAPIPSAPHLTAKAVRVALLMALAFVPAQERQAKLAACVQGGLRLVEM